MAPYAERQRRLGSPSNAILKRWVFNWRLKSSSDGWDLMMGGRSFQTWFYYRDGVLFKAELWDDDVMRSSVWEWVGEVTCWTSPWDSIESSRRWWIVSEPGALKSPQMTNGTLWDEMKSTSSSNSAMNENAMGPGGRYIDETMNDDLRVENLRWRLSKLEKCNLVNENDGRRILFGESEDVPHHPWSFSEVLLHKLWTNHPDEGS